LAGLTALALAVVLVSTPSAQQLQGCPMFPSNNIWNAPVDTLPLDSRSAAYVSSIGLGTGLHPDFGTVWNGAPIGIPYTTVPGSQPPVNITFYWPNESDPGPYPIPTDAPIEGGPTSQGDRHVLVVDQGHCKLYELYAATPQPDGSWRAGSGATWDLNSNLLRPATWTSADAAGLPILPGLVRYDEVFAGQVNHAIRFTANTTQQKYVWPARHYASSNTDPNVPPMGQRFRLRASFNTAGYPAQMQVILAAMKKYGIVLADNGSDWYINGAPDPRWDDDMLVTWMGKVKGSDFEAVDVSGLMVDPSSGLVGTPPTAAPTGTPTITSTVTLTRTPTSTVIVTPSASITATRTTTRTSTRTVTSTVSSSPTRTATPSSTPSPTGTPTASPSTNPSNTPTSLPTASPTTTSIPSSTASPTATQTSTPSAVATATPTGSATASQTVVPSTTPTSSATVTALATSTPNTTATPSPTRSPTSTPGRHKGHGHLSLTGRIAGPLLQVPLQVTIYQGSALVQTTSVISDQFGAFELSDVPDGPLTVRIKYAQAVTVQAMDGSLWGMPTYDFGPLPLGDVNGDDQVDVVDFSLLRSTFGTLTSCATPASLRLPCADLDANAQTDVVDFSLLRASFGRTSPPLP